jgi:transitional endoplasmic reticulum ATPase
MSHSQEIDMDFDFDLQQIEQAGSSLAAPDTDEAAGKRLKLSRTIDREILGELSHQGLDYFHWLRILILRSLLDTPARSALHGFFDYSMHMLAGFLGMPNLDDYCQQHTLIQVRKRLRSVLRHWEASHGKDCRFPPALEQNLGALARQVGLSKQETDLLGLCIVIVTEPIAENLSRVIGDIVGQRVERYLGPMLGYENECVATLLNKSGTLYNSGLLQFTLRREMSLRMLFDLLTDSFAYEMLKPLDDIRVLLRHFIEPADSSSPALGLHDYRHVIDDARLCITLLAGALERKSQGVNILIWGEPGTGKTQFARMLAAQVHAQLLEVCPHDADGEPISPATRIRNFSMAQKFYRDQPCLLMFDECEEVLPKSYFPASEASDSPRKSWINKTLETNVIPTIWIANSLEDFDPAYLRRFSICMEMPVPALAQRCQMLANAMGDAISEEARLSIASHEAVTPGIFSKAAEVLDIMAVNAATLPQQERDEQVIRMINSTLKAQGKEPIVRADQAPTNLQSGFEVTWLNTNVDLDSLCTRLRHACNARLCLSGIPGTGKTAFGKWLASELGMTHLSYKASDLLGCFVGETEQKIAAAFARAREEQALLQFDEVDSFLQERSQAFRHWETTQVNQMLTELEAYEGVFIATTNLLDKLDKASLRRFDMTIEFGTLKPEVAHQMFIRTCQELGLGDADRVDSSQIAALGALTPGDFDQLKRRSRLIPPASSVQVLQALSVAIGQKNAANHRPIGFMTSH